MGRPCTICASPKVDDINAALAGTTTPTGRIDVPAQAYRQVARFFGVHVESVRRHMRYHLPEGRITPAKKLQLRTASAFLSAVEELYSLTSGALTKAVEVGDLTAISRLVVAAQGLITTAARLTGELQDAAPQVAVVLRWGEDVALSANVAPPAALPALDAEVLKGDEERGS